MKRIVLIFSFCFIFANNPGIPLKENVLPKAYNASARFDAKEAYGITLSGSFLYWQSIVDRMQFVQHSSNASVNDGKIVNPKWLWRPGVKIGFGINLDLDDWQLFSEWLNILGKGKGRADLDSGYLAPINYSDAIRCDRAIYRLSNIFNSIDLYLTRPYYLGKNLILKPQFGLKGFWTRIKTNITYSNANGYYIATDDSLYSVEWEKYKLHYTNWGIGPNFGLKSNWLMGCGFKLIAEIKAAFVFNQGNVNEKNQVPTSSLLATTYAPNGEIHHARLKKVNTLCPLFDVNVGIAYELFSSWHLDIELAYNFLYFNNFISSYDGETDTMSHGGSLSLKFDF